MNKTNFKALLCSTFVTAILVSGFQSSDVRTIDVDQVLIPDKVMGLENYSSPSDGSEVSKILLQEMDFHEQNEISFFSKPTSQEESKFFNIVTLKRDNTASITEISQETRHYKGTYQVRSTGEIVLELKNYPGKWPVMRYLITGTIGGSLYPAEGFSEDVNAGWNLDYSHKYTTSSWPYKCLYHTEYPKLIHFFSPVFDIQLPSDQSAIHFELSVGIYTNVNPTDVSYVARDTEKWEYDEGDWRIPFVEEVMSTAMKWKYSPMVMGKSIQPCTLDYDCFVTKQSGGIKLVIQEVDDGLLIYDSSKDNKEIESNQNIKPMLKTPTE